jgi:hypothetical protein
MMIATKCEQILYGIRTAKRNGPYVMNICPLPDTRSVSLAGFSLGILRGRAA